ncbi:hypothetical protein [Kocuria aegyptia]|uniref:Uncharacterized protein n=1 Tax=Kocuria aegyptia TaxID=330943 RepID=A0ABP4XCS3_9MICC
MNDLLGLTPADFPATPSPLDAVVAPVAQRAFLDGRRRPIGCTGVSGRMLSPRLRRLVSAGGYEALVGFLAHYVALALPDPVATEGSFWAVETVVDVGVPAGEPQQLVRLRAHGVAVATVVEDPDGDGCEPLVCLALAPAPVVDRAYSPRRCYLDVEGAPVPAQHAEGPAGELGGRLLSDPQLLAAARRAVVGLMRLGPTGCAGHERDLADAVFTAITTTEDLIRPGDASV